jgi:hypothetical protein
MGVEGVLERRRAERTALLDRARRFVADVEATIQLRGAVVFGSVARGDFNRWSDIDLLLICDESPGDWMRRLDMLDPIPPPVQPFVWTVAEWVVQLRRNNPIAREAVEEGVWLRGSAADLGEALGP